MPDSIKVPKFLFHYTSINTLAFILRDKQFKFSSLPMVDDMEEEMLSRNLQHSKYCFISSWSSGRSESIPMWEMYSQGMYGVRIRLPSDLFPSYPLSDEVKLQYLKNPTYVHKFDISCTPVPVVKFFESNVNYLANVIGDSKPRLIKMEYSSDVKKIIPDLLLLDECQKKIFFNKIGICKRNCWRFQKEWRYILIVSPYNILRSLSTMSKEMMLKMMYDAKVDLPIKLDFLPVDLTKFKNMEITLGPMTNDADRLIVEALRDKFNPSASVIDSTLRGKIRMK